MIPFLDLKAQYAAIKAEIDAAVLEVLASSQYVLGPQVAAFESEFAAFCGAAQGVAVNSGTSALHLALLAAGIGPGCEVITTPHTFVATVAAIVYTGARPVFADIDPVSMTIDPAAVARAISPATKAIIPVHLYGQCADMDPILDMARKRGITVIEDACQAHGASYKGRMAGSMGDMACFSFYPGKNLGAYGEGGMVTTGNPDFVRTLRMLRDWGAERKYHHVLRGFNYRMEGLQGAILRVKLRHLPAWTESRRAVAAVYDRLLAGSSVIPPVELPGRRHVYHVYAVRSSGRDALQARLTDKGVGTGIHYPIPVHLLPAYADLGYGPGAFPETEKAASEVLSLPMYPELPLDMAETAAKLVKECAHGC
ncbi:MAG: DegT/DnrJ/EryC1/StrS family aminotransferase [Desulfovibrio sp.]|nr:DegT/DnrJ/EryC1/StrS family aminotransferase [Desulfovibrio sp.]